MRLLAAALTTGLLMGQTNSSISGRVLTGEGVEVGGASLTATQLETGLVRKALSDEHGRYVLASLPPGNYEIRTEAAGFQRLVHKEIRLTVGESASLDLLLQPGTTQQEITVAARIQLVNSQTSELSYLVSEGAIEQLPLNGRNYTDLALLQPGVVAYPHRDGGSVVAHGLGMSVNGQDPRSNVYLIDGTPQNDFTNGPAGRAASTVLGMETIREFLVETNVYSAEFGRNSGGQFSVLTKSGTNDPHGSLYYYHRNDNMDARNFFDPSRRPEFKRNQYGGALGGPLRKEKTFLFGGYEGLRERLGRTVNAIVPDANAHLGLIPDPANPGRLINVGVHPDVKPYLDEYPLPNGANLGDGLARLAYGFNQKLRQDFGQIRMDQNLGPGSQLFVRYTIDDADQRLPVDLPQFPRSFISRNQFLTAEYTRTLSANSLNTLRAGFSRTRIRQDVEANTSQPLKPFVPGRTLVGNIDIGGASRFGPQTSVDVRLTQNVYGVADDVALVRGRHSLKFGGLVERYQDNMVNPTFALGIHTFANLRGFLENRPQRFLGLAPEGALDRYWRFTVAGIYAQDNIAIRPGLTINLGLRYEATSLPVDIYGRDSALVHLNDPAPTPGKLYESSPKKNISPRFGFAWTPFGSGRSSLRGGYGWFFNTNNQQNLIVTVTNPPATPRLIIGAGTTFPVPPFERGVGNSMRPIQWDIKNPNLHVWNINWQQQLPAEFLLTVGYAGSRGIHLLRSGDVNIPAPQRLPDGSYFWPATATRPNPNFSTVELKSSDGNSWYYALIFEVRRRWRRGFNFQSSYTFSRNIDTTQASTFFSDATNGTTSAMPEPAGLNYNKGLADYHAKHNWVMNFTWELPFARALDGWAKQALDGWQFAGITNVRSGSPLTLFVQRNRSRSQWSPSLGPGIGFDRPSMAPGRTHADAVRGGPDQYFDPSAFVLQPAGTLGNLGRGTLAGPNMRALDLALQKNFYIPGRGDGWRLQFRVEAFNVLNHANFGIPTLSAFAGDRDGEQPLSSLGIIRSTVTSSRQIQLGLRFAF